MVAQSELLLREIRACRLCAPHLPLEPRPVLQFEATARILIVGQAPGMRVHKTGVPWNDPSGDRLRDWMGVDKALFYDASKVAIVPMGFCYPGTGKNGDLPPRPECAQRWRQEVHQCLPQVKLTLLVGQYAQNYYLSDSKATLTERVARWRDYLPDYLLLPHPSPRNNRWLVKNPWFEDVILELKKSIAGVLQDDIKE